MKKILENVCAFGCGMSVILAGGENPDGSCCLPWTLGCLAVAVVLGWATIKLGKPRRAAK